MSDLQYRTEDQRVRDGASPETHPYSSGDPFHPRTERERVADAERLTPVEYGTTGALLRDPETQHLVGIEQRPYVPHEQAGAEYPRWVTPHESQVKIANPTGYRQERGDFETENEIDRSDNANRDAKDSKLESKDGSLIVPRGAVVSVPGFEHHVRRHDGAIMVLVHNEDEEKRAMGEYKDAEPTTYISPLERLDAERIYQSEQGREEDKNREGRIVEIINERRKARLDQAEKELKAKRDLAEVKVGDIGTGRLVAGPAHAVESPMGVPLSGVEETPVASNPTAYGNPPRYASDPARASDDDTTRAQAERASHVTSAPDFTRR